jgi:hypothetical protein
MCRKLLLAVFAAIALAAGVASPMLYAQSTTASLLGIVHDPSGSVVPSAVITATNTQTSFTRTTQTDSEGNYLLPNLPIGPYQLKVSAPGFQTFVQTGITLVVSQNARVDAALAVGATSQTVQVDAQATGVDTHSASMGELVSRERIQELPLNGRNALTLAAVVPGVTNIINPPTVQTQSRGGAGLTISGGRDTQNEFRFDGTSWKNITQNTSLNLPSPDALQEFQILTSSPSAEYGRNSGGIVISVTRSGSNQFHGALWDYFRNTALNARNYFTRYPTKKPTLKQNQFGGSFGGPILRDKLFVFGSYQGTRIRQSQIVSPAFIPTAGQRSGFFGASTVLKNPIHGGFYTGGQVDPGDFDPVAVKMLNTFVPTSPAGAGVVQLVASPTNDNQYVVRGDYNVTAKDFLFVRYFRDKGTVTSQAGTISPYAPSDTSTSLQNWAAQATHTFSPSLLNELRMGVGRVDSNVAQKDTRQLSSFGATFPGVVTPQLPNINVSGFFNMNTTDLFNEHDNIYQLGDTVRWNRGKHSISIGGEVERLELYNFGSSGNNGTFTFDGSQTNNAFADFLIGRSAKLLQASPYHRNAKTWDGYFFAQDDFRVTNRLTLNLGVRYSIFQPFGITGSRTNTYRAGQQSVVNPSAPPGMVFPGDRGVQNGLAPTDYNNFAPRIGLAFDPRGDGRMSVRLAYGLFFEDLRSDIFTYAAVNQPFVISNTLNTPSSLVNPYSGHVNPFPYQYSPQTARFSFPMSLFTVPAPTLNAPYVHNLSASIQQQLAGGLQFNIGYVGKLEHNLIRMLQMNPAVYTGPSSTLANTDSRRPLLPGVYASFRQVCTCSDAAYHSLQTSLSKRYNNGFTFMLAYTYGKLLDYYSATNLGQTPQDPSNQRGDRGRSDFDRRHVFAGSIVYQIPFYKNVNPALRAIFSDWGVNSLVQLSTGNPFTVTTGRDASLTGVGFDRPNIVGIPYRSYASKTDMLSRFFNTSAFTANLPGSYGNAGRNILTGPGLANVNLSLVRSFPITERLGKVQFRSEFFNALNHTNFGQPDGNLANASTSFGTITTAGDPRIMQFALRYQF